MKNHWLVFLYASVLLSGFAISCILAILLWKKPPLTMDNVSPRVVDVQKATLHLQMLPRLSGLVGTNF